MKVGVREGYTVTVESWENDGDNVDVIDYVTEDLATAQALQHMCMHLFGGRGMGNTYDNAAAYAKYRDVVPKYINENTDRVHTLIEGMGYAGMHMDEIISDIATRVLGCSDIYMFRMCESAYISYSPENVYVHCVEEDFIEPGPAPTYIVTCAGEPCDPVKLVTTEIKDVLAYIQSENYDREFADGERWIKVTSWTQQKGMEDVSWKQLIA